MDLPDLTAKRAELDPDKLALVAPDHDRSVTYAELEIRASRLAEHLRDDWGVGYGDRIATLALNRTEAVEALFACAKLGAVLVPLNWRLAPTELEYVLRDADVVALIHDADHAATARRLSDLLSSRTRQLRLLDFDDGYEQALAAAPGRSMAHAPRDERALWYLMYTSGTTGRPKGVAQTAGMALVNHLNIGMATGIVASDVFLAVLPQFHTGGWNLFTLPMMFVGGTAVIPARFDAGQALALLAKDTSLFFGVPAIYQMLAEHPDFATTDLSGVRSWSAGGAAMSVPLLRRLGAAGVEVRQGMGMTETGPTVFLLDEQNAISKAGSVGKPQPFVDVRIVDEHGGEVASGESGELLIRGPGVTPGYWRNPDATRAAFTDGWLRTGDVARQDGEGFFYVVDRIKDMFISGGENVYPAEVEAVIHQLPGVRAAAVIGVPHDRWGEVGRALVEPEAGEKLDADALRAHCREHLASYKVPVSFEIVEELPRSATGKILKHVLRADRLAVS